MQPQPSIWQQIQPTVVLALQGLIPVLSTALIVWIRRRARLNGTPSTPIPLVVERPEVVPLSPFVRAPSAPPPAPSEGPTLPSVAPPLTSKGDKQPP